MKKATCFSTEILLLLLVLHIKACKRYIFLWKRSAYRHSKNNNKNSNFVKILLVVRCSMGEAKKEENANRKKNY